MKSFCCRAFIATAALTATAFAQPVINGRYDPAYCLPIVTQNTQTQFGDASQGLIDRASGSELDAAYTKVQGGVLYLLVTGNLESNFNKLEIFFDTRTGGQNRLRGDNPVVDFDGLNRMGETTPDVTGDGMRFDTGFEADFWLSCTNGGDDHAIFANYAELRISPSEPGVGRYLGTTEAGSDGVLSGGDNPDNIRLTINNSNVGGVSGGTALVTDPSIGASVLTGIEVAIPLAAIGNPSGPFKITVMVNGSGHNFMSNQILGGLGGGSNLGEPRNIDFSTIAGDQFFTSALSSDPCGACCIGTPATTCTINTSAGCTTAGGTFLGVDISCDGNPCTPDPEGACCLPGPTCEIRTQADCLSGGGEYLGDATTCAGNPCAVGACCTGQTCTLRREEACEAIVGAVYQGDGTDCSSEPCRSGACCIGGVICVVISPTSCTNQGGTYQGDATTCASCPAPPADLPPVNGTVESLYGTAITIQDTQTGFGDSSLGLVDRANGSELDGAFAYISRGRLHLMLTGNLETNSNKLEIFFDTRAGGQNQLVGDNPDVDFNGLNRMGAGTGPDGPGLRFDDGFAADFYVTANCSFSPVNGLFELFGNWARLRTPEDAGQGRYLGKGTAASDGGLSGGDNPDAILMTINNSNVLGVTGGLGVIFGGGDGVTTGIEMSIPLRALGNPTGNFKICTFINGQRHDFVSNQSLAGGLWILAGYPGEPRTVNFNETTDPPGIAGPQFFTVTYVPPSLLGDSNCDGDVNFTDIDCFVSALVSQSAWDGCGHDPGCSYLDVNDIDGSGSVTFDDISGFVTCLVLSGCP